MMPLSAFSLCRICLQSVLPYCRTGFEICAGESCNTFRTLVVNLEHFFTTFCLLWLWVRGIYCYVQFTWRNCLVWWRSQYEQSTYFLRNFFFFKKKLFFPIFQDELSLYVSSDGGPSLSKDEFVADKWKLVKPLLPGQGQVNRSILEKNLKD